MLTRPRLAFLAFFVAALMLCAGCLQSEPEEDDTGPAWVDPIPDGGEHDHTDETQHQFWSENMQLRGHNTLNDRAYAEVNLHGNYAYLAGWDHISIVDISDPNNMELVGEYEDPQTAVMDVKIFADGNYLIANNQGVGNIADPDPGIVDQDDRAEVAVTLLDVSDKTNPVQVDAWNDPDHPSGPHNVFPHQINGEWYAFLANPEYNDDSQNGFEAGGVMILHMDLDSPDGTIFRKVGEYQPDLADTNGGWVYIHDMTVQTWPDPNDPVHGRNTYIYTAYWDGGVRIVDVSDPPTLSNRPNEYLTASWSPEEVGTWYEDLTIEMDNLSNIHYTEPFDDLVLFEDGTYHHITVAAPETIGTGNNGDADGGGTGVIWFLDTTDFDNISVLGTWELAKNKPFEAGNDSCPWPCLLFSPHNIDTGDGRAWISHYHAGLWVLDVSTEEKLRNPETDGYYLPHGSEYSPDTPLNHLRVPDLWAAEYDDDSDTVYLSCISTGIYSVEWTGPYTGPTAPEGFWEPTNEY